jgi:hypothetical protein
MRLEIKLKKFSRFLFRKNNIKYILFLLIVAFSIFLFIGNYNLVLKEGLSLEEDISKMNEDAFNANKTNNGYRNLETEQEKLKKLHPKPTEGYSNKCNEISANDVGSGNKATRNIRNMCNIDEKLAIQNNV